MAGENRTGNTGTKEPIQFETERTGGSGQNRNPGTQSTGERTGAGTTAGATTGTDTKKENISRLVDVTEEIPTPKKAKKKRTRTTKKNDAPFNEEQIKGVIMVMSGIMGQSETGKIFALSEGEAEQIAKPLANIIAKNDSLSGLGEHADSIALITACVMIFIPRLIIFLQYQKNKKAMKDKNIKIYKGVDKNGEKGKTEPRDKSANGTVAPGGTNGSENILSAIPSLA